MPLGSDVSFLVLFCFFKKMILFVLLRERKSTNGGIRGAEGEGEEQTPHLSNT